MQGRCWVGQTLAARAAGRDATVSGTSLVADETGFGASGSVSYVAGTPTQLVDLVCGLWGTFTICSI